MKNMPKILAESSDKEMVSRIIQIVNEVQKMKKVKIVTDAYRKDYALTLERINKFIRRNTFK